MERIDIAADRYKALLPEISPADHGTFRECLSGMVQHAVNAYMFSGSFGTQDARDILADYGLTEYRQHVGAMRDIAIDIACDDINRTRRQLGIIR